MHEQHSDRWPAASEAEHLHKRTQRHRHCYATDTHTTADASTLTQLHENVLHIGVLLRTGFQVDGVDLVRIALCDGAIYLL